MSCAINSLASLVPHPGCGAGLGSDDLVAFAGCLLFALALGFALAFGLGLVDLVVGFAIL